MSDRSGADEVNSPTDRFHSRHQFRRGIGLDYVSTGATEESVLNDVPVAELTHKQDDRVCRKVSDLASNFDATEIGKANIQKDQVRLSFPYFLNGFDSVLCFANDLETRNLLEGWAEKIAKRGKIINQENASGSIKSIPSDCCPTDFNCSSPLSCISFRRSRK